MAETWGLPWRSGESGGVGEVSGRGATPCRARSHGRVPAGFPTSSCSPRFQVVHRSARRRNVKAPRGGECRWRRRRESPSARSCPAAWRGTPFRTGRSHSAKDERHCMRSCASRQAPLPRGNAGFRLHRRISRSNRNESRACRLARTPNGFFHKPLKSQKRRIGVLPFDVF